MERLLKLLITVTAIIGHAAAQELHAAGKGKGKGNGGASHGTSDNQSAADANSTFANTTATQPPAMANTTTSTSATPQAVNLTATQPTTVAVPIYVFYHRTAVNHYYTQSATIPSGYHSHGIAFYAFASAIPGTVPIYRYYRRSSVNHYYATSATTPGGYISDGIAFYAFASAAPGTVPVYMYYHQTAVNHYYTLSSRAPSGYHSYGIQFYVFNQNTTSPTNTTATPQANTSTSTAKIQSAPNITTTTAFRPTTTGQATTTVGQASYHLYALTNSCPFWSQPISSNAECTSMATAVCSLGFTVAGSYSNTPIGCFAYSSNSYTGCRVYWNDLTGPNPTLTSAYKICKAVSCASRGSCSIGCDFEAGTCGWQTSQWKHHHGPTPSSATGPASALHGLYYMYVESSYENSPNKGPFILETHTIPQRKSNFTLSFFYHMYGAGMGRLSVQVFGSNLVASGASSILWDTIGNRGNAWHLAQVLVPASATKIQFVATTGSDYTSDIAVDAITFIDSINATTAPTTTTTTATTTSKKASYLLTLGHLCPNGYWPITSGWQNCESAALSLGFTGDSVGHVSYMATTCNFWGTTKPQGCYRSTGNGRFHYNCGAGGSSSGSDSILCQTTQTTTKALTTTTMKACIDISGQYFSPTENLYRTYAASHGAGCTGTTSWGPTYVINGNHISLSDTASGTISGSSGQFSISYTNGVLHTQATTTYQAFRFTTTKTRIANNYVQIAEIEFGVNGQAMSLTGAVASNPGGDSPQSEAPDKAIDGSVGTKWLDKNVRTLYVTLQHPLYVDSFRFITANDATGRDPVQWQCDAQELNGSWVSLHSQSTDFKTPTARHTATSWFQQGTTTTATTTSKASTTTTHAPYKSFDSCLCGTGYTPITSLAGCAAAATFFKRVPPTQTTAWGSAPVPACFSINAPTDNIVYYKDSGTMQWCNLWITIFCKLGETTTTTTTGPKKNAPQQTTTTTTRRKTTTTTTNNSPQTTIKINTTRTTNSTSTTTTIPVCSIPTLLQYLNCPTVSGEVRVAGSLQTCAQTCTARGFTCAEWQTDWSQCVCTKDSSVSSDGALRYAAVCSCSGIYQAEAAMLSGAIIIGTTVSFQNNFNDFIEWTVTGCSGGSYAAAFKYALGYGSRPLDLQVNGVTVASSVDFPATGSWSTWLEKHVAVHLVAGVNTIKLLAIGSSGGKFDWLSLTKAQLCSGILQAEAAAVSGVKIVGAIVDFQNNFNDFIEWTVTGCSGGSYVAAFKYALGSGNRPLDLQVNGVTVASSVDFPATGSWSISLEKHVTVHLVAGVNTIKLLAIGSSGGNFDWLTLTKTSTSTNTTSSTNASLVPTVMVQGAFNCVAASASSAQVVVAAQRTLATEFQVAQSHVAVTTTESRRLGQPTSEGSRRLAGNWLVQYSVAISQSQVQAARIKIDTISSNSSALSNSLKAQLIAAGLSSASLTNFAISYFTGSLIGAATTTTASQVANITTNTTSTPQTTTTTTNTTSTPQTTTTTTNTTSTPQTTTTTTNTTTTPQTTTTTTNTTTTPQGSLLCRGYCSTRGCGWTYIWSCPWAATPGTSGRAGDDGSIGYMCCCTIRTADSQLCGGVQASINQLDPSWILVFQRGQININNLSLLENFRSSDGKFFFKLVYPALWAPNSNEWVQSSNPMITSGAPQGYNPINIGLPDADTANAFHGLQKGILPGDIIHNYDPMYPDRRWFLIREAASFPSCCGQYHETKVQLFVKKQITTTTNQTTSTGWATTTTVTSITTTASTTKKATIATTNSTSTTTTVQMTTRTNTTTWVPAACYYTQLLGPCANPTHISGNLSVSSVDQCKMHCDGQMSCGGFDSDGSLCYLKGNCEGRPGSGIGYKKVQFSTPCTGANIHGSSSLNSTVTAASTTSTTRRHTTLATSTSATSTSAASSTTATTSANFHSIFQKQMAGHIVFVVLPWGKCADIAFQRVTSHQECLQANTLFIGGKATMGGNNECSFHSLQHGFFPVCSLNVLQSPAIHANVTGRIDVAVWDGTDPQDFMKQPLRVPMEQSIAELFVDSPAVSVKAIHLATQLASSTMSPLSGQMRLIVSTNFSVHYDVIVHAETTAGLLVSTMKTSESDLQAQFTTRLSTINLTVIEIHPSSVSAMNPKPSGLPSGNSAAQNPPPLMVIIIASAATGVTAFCVLCCCACRFRYMEKCASSSSVFFGHLSTAYVTQDTQASSGSSSSRAVVNCSSTSHASTPDPPSLRTEKKYHFFLSHKKEHSVHGNCSEHVALHLHDMLENMGWIGFFDVDDLKVISREELASNIQASCTVVVVLSDETCDSEWCQLEWEVAQRKGIPVCCVIDLLRFNKKPVLDQVASTNPHLLAHQWIEYTDMSRKSVAKSCSDWLTQMMAFQQDAAEEIMIACGSGSSVGGHSVHSSRKKLSRDTSCDLRNVSFAESVGDCGQRADSWSIENMETHLSYDDVEYDQSCTEDSEQEGCSELRKQLQALHDRRSTPSILVDLDAEESDLPDFAHSVTPKFLFHL